MNKIYKAFDSIKFNKELKNKAIQRLTEKKYKTNYAKIIHISTFSLIGIVVCLFILVTNNSSYNPTDSRVKGDSFTASESSNNKFLYNNHFYSLVEDAYDLHLEIKSEIGTLRQIEKGDELKENFDSYNNGGFLVYTTNDDMVLIIKKDNNILVYRKMI